MPQFPQDRIIYFFVFGAVFLFLVWGFMPPRHFPARAIVNVEEGFGLYQLSQQLEDEGIIRSPFWFRTITIISGGERGMKAGQYYFEKPENPFSVARRILAGDHRIESIKLTIPEGFNIKKISALFDEERFAFFDNAAFEQFAPEGYIFPDTYFVPVTATASSTIKLMRDNFVRKIFPLMPDVELSGKTLEDIIIMASLIEGEANNQDDREIVSGVLWKRLSLGMALQVDVEMKTYEFPGLPEFPINNPGLFSIQAALHPTTTPYLYYLTGDDGKMYYSRTFDEHVAKKQQYIR